MTIEEFSNTFDILLNNYGSQGEFGEQASKTEIILDEYEKSILLTQAQDIILKQYFEGDENNNGFDNSNRRQIDFSNLISVDEISEDITSSVTKYDERSKIFKTPNISITNNSTTIYKSKVLYILNEKIITTINDAKKQYIVVPINYREYDRQMSKAYSQPLKKQAWRLFQGNNSNGNTSIDIYSEIIPTDSSISESPSIVYKIRYIRRPKPIILTSLNLDTQEDLEIDGMKDVSECELNPILHMDVLRKAVELAYTTRGGKSTK